MLGRGERLLEHEIRTSLEGFTRRLRAAIDAEMDALATELMQAADAADRRAKASAAAAIAEETAALQAREAAARADAESQMSQRLDAAREEARIEARALALEEANAAAEAARVAPETEAATARASEREARLAAVERLLASVRRLDATATLRETLEVLVQSASLETPRVAVLLIEGSTVRPFSQRGFTDLPASGPIAPGGVVEACVTNGQVAFTSDAAALKAPGFAALPEDRAGFAAPIRVGNRTVAVLYADDAGEGERDAPAAWPEALELLARHVSIHLENLTAVRASAALAQSGDDTAVSTTGVAAAEPRETLRGPIDDEGARRYARLLISEIKLYNEGAVRHAREQRDLRTRLAPEIARAHRQYRERVPETIASRDRYFEAELVATLADGDASLL
jgi:hypothetical protein